MHTCRYSTLVRVNSKGNMNSDLCVYVNGNKAVLRQISSPKDLSSVKLFSDACISTFSQDFETGNFMAVSYDGDMSVFNVKNNEI